ncbi:uncharacterized protein [Littorina saxatilis]|uniref:Uncharacterized protein n=1 Tax=Littorina saxatilis TaxID=31220 RepID=A0AAN9GGR4_9CAEN
MEVVKLLVLCMCLHGVVGEWQKWTCEAGGKSSIKPFGGRYRRPYFNLPCRYKMANVKCKGDQTEVFAENDLAFTWKRDLFISAVTIRIHTKNDNGCKTYQTLTLNTANFTQYLSKKNYSASPWEWSSNGCQIDADKKNVGFYETYRRMAKVTVGKLTVSYQYTTNTMRRARNIPTLEIRCVGHKFKSFENYPESFCGTENTTQEDLDAVERQIPGDSRRVLGTGYMYAALAKQPDVQQTDPQCQEIQRFAQGQCRSWGDKNSECQSILGRWGESGSRRGYCEGRGDNRFKVYMECMRVKCGLVCNSQGPDGTCETLKRAAKECEDSGSIGGVLNALLVQANCPRHLKYAIKGSSNWVQTYKKQACTVIDKEFSWWGRTSFKDMSTFFTDRGFRITIPCSYKMADIVCGGVQSQVTAEHALDKQGRAFVSKVTVTTYIYYNRTYNGRTYRTRGFYVNTLRDINLKRFIKTREAENKTDPWIGTWRGSELAGDDRVLGRYDNNTKSAILEHRGLKVTFRYTDSRQAVRPDNPALEIRCSDPDFRAKEKFPGTLCGSPETSQNTLVGDLVKNIPAQPGHTSYNKDVVLLAYQNIKEGGKDCKEVANILEKGCVNMGDVLTECHLMYDMTATDLNYAQCAHKKRDLDPFKLYVTCLRVLCGAEGYTSSETCGTLRQVNDACRHQVKHPHLHISNLMQQAVCRQNSTSNATS